MYETFTLVEPPHSFVLLCCDGVVHYVKNPRREYETVQDHYVPWCRSVNIMVEPRVLSREEGHAVTCMVCLRADA